MWTSVLRHEKKIEHGDEGHGGAPPGRWAQVVEPGSWLGRSAEHQRPA